MKTVIKYLENKLEDVKLKNWLASNIFNETTILINELKDAISILKNDNNSNLTENFNFCEIKDGVLFPLLSELNEDACEIIKNNHSRVFDKYIYKKTVHNEITLEKKMNYYDDLIIKPEHIYIQRVEGKHTILTKELFLCNSK